MKFRKPAPTDYQRLIRPTFTRAEMVAIYNAVLIDLTSDANRNPETEDLLGKLATVLDAPEPIVGGRPAPPPKA
ncbi:MAG: hypothetical protein WBA17_17155 [Saprospiraceae bacterium]